METLNINIFVKWHQCFVEGDDDSQILFSLKELSFFISSSLKVKGNISYRYRTRFISAFQKALSL